jgi:hypothetical protein
LAHCANVLGDVCAAPRQTPARCADVLGDLCAPPRRTPARCADALADLCAGSWRTRQTGALRRCSGRLRACGCAHIPIVRGVSPLFRTFSTSICSWILENPHAPTLFVFCVHCWCSWVPWRCRLNLMPPGTLGHIRGESIPWIVPRLHPCCGPWAILSGSRGRTRNVSLRRVPSWEYAL